VYCTNEGVGVALAVFFLAADADEASNVIAAIANDEKRIIKKEGF
jgi:hypothetical protein